MTGSHAFASQVSDWVRSKPTSQDAPRLSTTQLRSWAAQDHERAPSPDGGAVYPQCAPRARCAGCRAPNHGVLQKQCTAFSCSRLLTVTNEQANAQRSGDAHRHLAAGTSCFAHSPQARHSTHWRLLVRCRNAAFLQAACVTRENRTRRAGFELQICTGRRDATRDNEEDIHAPTPMLHLAGPTVSILHRKFCTASRSCRALSG